MAIAGAKKIGEKEWMVVSVYTAPESRGKGIAKELLEKVIAECETNGALKLLLMVNTEQENAIRVCYEKNHSGGKTGRIVFSFLIRAKLAREYRNGGSE